MTDQELIKRCLRNERRAQEVLYGRYSPSMFGICRRYFPDVSDAEHIMVKGFHKAFTNLGQYKAKGAFGGWLRRIMVNECLMELRKRRNFNISLEESNVTAARPPAVEPEMAAGEILALLHLLPSGYRTVFNLFAIEGYSHEEIANELGISVNTSKSQLLKARKRLQEYLHHYHISTGS